MRRQRSPQPYTRARLFFDTWKIAKYSILGEGKEEITWRFCFTIFSLKCLIFRIEARPWCSELKPKIIESAFIRSLTILLFTCFPNCTIQYIHERYGIPIFVSIQSFFFSLMIATAWNVTSEYLFLCNSYITCIKINVMYVYVYCLFISIRYIL